VTGMLVLIRSGSEPEFLTAAADQLLASVKTHRSNTES
jgi:hypothetical protein